MGVSRGGGGSKGIENGGQGGVRGKVGFQERKRGVRQGELGGPGWGPAWMVLKRGLWGG